MVGEGSCNLDKPAKHALDGGFHLRGTEGGLDLQLLYCLACPGDEKVPIGDDLSGQPQLQILHQERKSREG